MLLSIIMLCSLGLLNSLICNRLLAPHLINYSPIPLNVVSDNSKSQHIISSSNGYNDPTSTKTFGFRVDEADFDIITEYLKSIHIADINSFCQSLDGEGKMRLKLLACGDKKLVYTTFDKEFASFSQLTNNSWSSESSNNLDLSLFWLNYNNKVYLKVLRCQLSNGLCSMNAAVVLQHYLVTINEPDDAQNLGMLNLGKYIGATLKARDLETYLTTPTDLPTGGTTISFLKKSCGLTSRDLYHISIPIITESTLHLVEARDQICEEVMRRLKYQPALISSFIVNKNFTRLGSISFTTGPDFDSD